MYIFTTQQDQQQFIVPLNRDTERIWYNIHMIIDSPVLINQREWEVSKINRISPNGLVRVTLAQTAYNPENNYIELDEDGNVVAMYADYYKSGVEPTPVEDINTNTHSVITYSGTSPVIKINGNYKKFTVKFYDEIGQVKHQRGKWKFTIDGNDVSSLIETDTDGLGENQIKVKFIGSDDYITSDLVVAYESVSGITSSVNMNIEGL